VEDFAMESPGNDRRDFARAIYETHIRQWREIERQRLFLTLAYVAVTMAALIVLGQGIFLMQNWPAILFLLALAKIGYLLSFHQAVRIESHKSAAHFVLERYSLLHYWPPDDVPLMLRLVPVDRLFPIFYLFAFCFFLLTLLYVITLNAPLSIVVAALFYGIMFIVTLMYGARKN
jgi:hypothetical protein